MDTKVIFLNTTADNPFLLASAPPTANAEMMARAFDMGWAGAVIKTISKDPVKNVQNRFHSYRLGKRTFAFQNIELLSENPPETWYKDIRFLKERFPEKLVIGSIMGDAKTPSQWIELALGCQDAGADMIECNFSCPHGYPEKGMGSAIGQNAEFSSKIIKWIKEDSRIHTPIIAKLTAAVTDISYIGNEIKKAGADGFCAINTYPSLMGFNLKTLLPKPSIGGYATYGGYSGPGIKPIALKCVHDLTVNTNLPVMASGGISNCDDALEFMMLGAPLVQICTEVMLKGYSIIKKLNSQLLEFMDYHKFNSTTDFIGLGNKKIIQYSDLPRDNFYSADINIEKCKSCNACYNACKDAANNAIYFENEKIKVKTKKCIGCSLCFQVCTNDAIKLGSHFKQ